MIAVGLESAREIEPSIVAGPVAQWITRLTTDQKIPGSNPGRFGCFSINSRLTSKWTRHRSYNVSQPILHMNETSAY